MDEAHRYRAKAGFKAIADLRPMLGIELTATPKTVGAKPVDFKNVIYRYGLGGGDGRTASSRSRPSPLARISTRKA